MSIDFTEPDNGTPEWAAEQAAALMGVAMFRHMESGSPREAADCLASLSSFALGLIMDTPALRKARYSLGGKP